MQRTPSFISNLALVSQMLLLGGCATQEYRYVATGQSQTDPTLRRRGEAVYPIPATAPMGTVRVMSMGIVDLKPKEDGAKISALHLRITVSNRNTSPTVPAWLLDTQKQTVSFPNAGQSVPIYVNSDVPTLPVIEIKANELKTADLFFQLPLTEQTSRELPEYTFHWQIQTATEVVSQNTSFERRPIYERAAIYPYEPYPYVVGWGPVWWGGGMSWREGRRW